MSIDFNGGNGENRQAFVVKTDGSAIFLVAFSAAIGYNTGEIQKEAVSYGC